MFSVPLICSSSGVATVCAITFGLAPGNSAFTTTDGGTTSGYSEIGNWVIAIRPARKIITEITPAKIGRSMKNLDRFMASPEVRFFRSELWLTLRQAQGEGWCGRHAAEVPHPELVEG